jgi:magnesium transporter
MEIDHMQFPKHSAGRIMSCKVPMFSMNHDLGTLRELFSKHVKEYETINYIYLLDAEEKLAGVLSIRDLFHYGGDTRASEIMSRELVVAKPLTDRERAANLALAHNIKAVPVVDKEHKLVGVVSSDAILETLQLEHTEDLLRGGGMVKTEGISRNLSQASAGLMARARLPWLLVGLIGGILAAKVITSFEEVLAEELLLASFIPVIVYMSDAVSTQSQTIFIRTSALERQFQVRRYLFREFIAAIIISAVISLFVAVATSIFFSGSHLQIILPLSMFVSIIFAVIIGLLIPLLLSRMGKDPAIASGPFATILTDILSISCYFGIAQLILGAA